IWLDRSGPGDVAFEIKRPQAEVRHVDVDRFPVGYGRLGNETVFAMASTGRPAGVELFFPFDIAGFEVEAIEQVMNGDFTRQLDVALGEAFDDLLYRQSLLFELGGVLVAVLGAGLR